MYRAALTGPFLSDDLWMVTNPYVMSPGPDFVPAVLDREGAARFLAMGNYMPPVFVAHAIGWKLWGWDTRGHHVANVLVHALNTSLLVALLMASSVPRTAAVAAGAFFALHPANVEAVAWISQLRTLLCTGLALAALLAFRRHPLWSAAPFGLALLCKASAAFALPMLAALCWARRATGGTSRAHAAGLALWGVVFALYAPIQLDGFGVIASSYAPGFPDAATAVRSIAAIGARYLAMAVGAWGVSAFHEPEPVRTFLDPWTLAGLGLAPLFAWRLVATLVRRSEEAAWWIGAAAGFVPISQIVPFLYPIGDRFLYLILPGLLGGTLLAARELRPGVRLRAAAWAVTALWLAGFAVQTSARAALWQSEDRLNSDAAAHYPDGSVAHGVAALDALEAGDRERALESVLRSIERGGAVTWSMTTNRRFEPFRDEPRFRERIREAVRWQIDFLREQDLWGHTTLLALAAGHLYLGEPDEAIAAAERGLRLPGPFQAELVDARMAALRQRREAARAAGEPGLSRPSSP